MEYIVTLFCFFAFITSIIMTIKLRFPQFRVRKKVKENETKESRKAFLFSLASHIGTGNIIGMTSGIVLGGVGVIVWLWIFSFFNSSFALVENTYGQVYKEKIDNEYRGGACFYLEKGLNFKRISYLFMLFLVINNTIFFPPIQMNAIVMAGDIYFKSYRILLGIVILGIIIFIIVKGTKRMVATMEKMVPFMSILYTAIVIGIILINIKLMPRIIYQIIDSAFNIRSFGVGAIVNQMTLGIRRGLFSNEAGLGTTPSISSMVNVKNPTTSGYIQMRGVYIDSLLLCTITGILIVLSGIDTSQYLGGEILIFVFEKYLGFFGGVLAYFLLFCFGFSSIIGGYYLGETNMLYLGTRVKISFSLLKKIFFILFVTGQIIGIFVTTFTALKLVDIGLAILGTINIIALFILEKRLRIVRNNQ